MLHRRDAMLRLGQVGLGALTLPTLLQAEVFTVRAAEPASRPLGRAKSCILVYLWGGPPQQDMWDLKPLAPLGIRSAFAPIATVVPGIDVSEALPLFARHTDKTAIIRSLTHDSNNHEPSVYRTLTGRVNNTLVVPRNQRNRNDAPNLGSVISACSPSGPLPAAITIPRPIGHSGVTYSGTHAGWLGARHDPFETAAAADTPEQATHSMDLPPDLASTRLLGRRGLLRVLEDVDRRFDDLSATRSLAACREQALSLLTSSAAKQAFQLDQESPETRDRYGRNEWGECFLMARRLVEAGTRLVTISWMYIKADGKVANVWDNHGGTPGLNPSGFGMLKEPYCIPSLDRGFAALMDDLSQRGLLDDTLVAMFGEFGRTPLINKTDGRDHWGAVQSAVLAGGGIRGGQVYGSSDKDAAYPASNPVSPEDMLATIYWALGVDPARELLDAQGRPSRIIDGEPLTMLF